MVCSFQNKQGCRKEEGDFIHLFQSVSLYKIILRSVHLDMLFKPMCVLFNIFKVGEDWFFMGWFYSLETTKINGQMNQLVKTIFSERGKKGRESKERERERERRTYNETNSLESLVRRQLQNTVDNGRRAQVSTPRLFWKLAFILINKTQLVFKISINFSYFSTHENQ